MKDLPTAYNPKENEESIYKFWEDNGYFKADATSEKPPYSIVIPPPNVTGVLHMGHALDGTLQDVLIRYHRMKGYESLWLPGTDHAGIATQNVVEKKLREEGKTRHDLGREEFVNVVWDWANEHKSKILSQFKRLGASFDLSRERFTLDEGCSKAVREVFVSLYNKGLIYKGSYTVNWCPRCQSAISDIETDYKTEQGHLWEISYPLKDRLGAIVVATTRPETIFGDVAVAVNPNDPRYSDLIGEMVAIPLIGREIPVIADEYVDTEFGTGAVKITPAHDANDYEVGKRHGLKPLWIMDTQGVMIDDKSLPAEIRGLNRFEARQQTVEMLERQGQLVRTLPHEHNVGHCQRCGETIEPYLSEQWFVKMKPLAEKGIEAINTGELSFVPERWTKIYLDWMENIRDWCISRQLWWGHQIPAYYCEDCGEMVVATEHPEKCTKCPSTKLIQDTDVLDTWFSSGLWPFSTMGWPDKESPDFKKFYPTTTLVTGFDIIFFWVARMVVMGYEFTGQAPFSTVFIHGLIRDEHGQKMSKSKGNTIDPVEIIEKYGTDALRFTLASMVTYGGQDIKLSDERFEYGRNFANKIWNASRFVLMNIEDVDNEFIDMSSLTIADRWILDKLNQTAQEVNKNISSYRVGETAQLLYEFFWNNYCDWYVEMAKVQLQNEELKANTKRVLKFVLERSLRLFHPIMPHITEKIWQLIPGETYKDGVSSIMLAKYPEYDAALANSEVENKLNFVIDTVKGLRNIRQSLNIQPAARINVLIYSESADEHSTINEAAPYLKLFARIDNLEVKQGVPESIPPQAATGVIGTSRVIVPLAGVIDIDKETARQQKKLDTLLKEKQGIDGRLSNPKFVENAKAEVIQQAKDRLEELNQQVAAVEELLKSLVG